MNVNYSSRLLEFCNGYCEFIITISFVQDYSPKLHPEKKSTSSADMLLINM